MKSLIKYFLTVLVMLMVALDATAQQPDLANFRDPGQEGLNVFEAPKSESLQFEYLRVRVGGDFAIQLQGLSQSNDFALGVAGDPTSMAELSTNFNLPTANLNLDVLLAKGVRLHMRTYLSSKHHVEGWVKGGYLQIDNLNFISEGFLSDLMEVLRIRAGMDDINYGDAHFRRSDNARAIYNPFVGNYLMDSFTTEPFLEVSYLNNGIIGVLGVTNGRLNQSPTPGDDGFVIFGKAGYDTQVNDDLRFRITGSFYNSSEESTRDYLYGGDRAGSRYYAILNTPDQLARGGRPNDFSGRFNPGFGSLSSFMINPFVKFQGLEFFGLLELISNNDDVGGSFTHLGGELLYRFGDAEDVYLGGRFNSVSGEMADGAPSAEVSRINIGGGWFMTSNILTKLEFVSQSYSGDAWNGSIFQGAEFSGVMLEAVISF